MSELTSNADHNFIVNMKASREAREWTQANLAEFLQMSCQLEINQTAVSRIEKGEREVRLTEARAIAGAFSTTVDALSSPPEEFAVILEWNRLNGALANAEPNLRIAAAKYEEARRALSAYLTKPKVRLDKTVEEAILEKVQRDAVDIVSDIVQTAKLVAKRNAAEAAEFANAPDEVRSLSDLAVYLRASKESNAQNQGPDG